MGKKTYYHDPVLFAVNKPEGPSSAAVVGAVKKILARDEKPHRKIGHFGTLDPFAEGLLLIGANGATKLTNYFHEDLSKTYRAVGVFGQQTPTGDYMSLDAKKESKTIGGENLELREKTPSKLEEFFCERFIGEYWQRPQTYSAAKHQGKALYRWAREGRPVEKPPVKREIFSFEVEEFSYPFISFVVRVSSGTYIRSLFEDMARVFNVGGHLRALKRVAIGELSLDGALEISWEADSGSFSPIGREELERAKHSPDQVLSYPERRVNEERARDFCHGRDLFWQGNNEDSEISFGQRVWILGDFLRGKRILGLAERGEFSDGPLIVFPNPQKDVLDTE